MECPFCAEDFNEEARVCKNCGRDLRLVRPLIDQNVKLIAQIEDLQLQVDKARAAIERETTPIRFWSFHSAFYVVVPALLLIAAHFVIIIALDISPLYLRLASMVIPLPFGFALLWFSQHNIQWSILDGILIGLLSVMAMLTIVSLVDRVPILPDNVRDWRETLEYVASIALANVTGAVVAILTRRMLPRTLDASGAPSPVAMIIARTIGRHVGEQALRRRAQTIQDNFGTVATAGAAAAAAAGSIYTGIRALWG
ncbi:MAG TPA: hypothetical protein VEJ43_09230 [Pseudolabrys sp.]|nr:hypothetical protein [Pseudolabrys sp.]